VECNGAAPANIYAFQKQSWTTSPMREAAVSPEWVIIGLRYFNVYGPREAHKGVPASMVYHLSRQMKAGQRPRIFKHGDQKRDFVYVKDIVEGAFSHSRRMKAGFTTWAAAKPARSTILFDILNKCLGTNFEPDYIDNPHAHYQNFTEADLSRVGSALGYAPQFPLEDGVPRLHEMALSKRRNHETEKIRSPRRNCRTHRY